MSFKKSYIYNENYIPSDKKKAKILKYDGKNILVSTKCPANASVVGKTYMKKNKSKEAADLLYLEKYEETNEDDIKDVSLEIVDKENDKKKSDKTGYILEECKKGKTLGYINVGDDNFIEIKRKNHFLLLIILLILLLGTALVFLSRQSTSESKKGNGSIAVADADDIANIPAKDEIDYSENIELPYLSTAEVDKTYKFIPLQNPEGNTVYMTFTVIYNDQEIYTTKGAVAPGKYVTWDAYSFFNGEAGEYNVTFKIETYDTLDSSGCSGANIESTITVN